VAARLARDLQLSADIMEGRRGEFSVWVGGVKVAEKAGGVFPDDDDIVAAVRQATSAS
jgi:hypothetical protein